MARVQIKRTATPNAPPTGLQPGELALEMGVPTRLWVGVPAAQDASLKKLLLDLSAVPSATLPEAPNDGVSYTRSGLAWKAGGTFKRGVVIDAAASGDSPALHIPGGKMTLTMPAASLNGSYGIAATATGAGGAIVGYDANGTSSGLFGYGGYGVYCNGPSLFTGQLLVSGTARLQNLASYNAVSGAAAQCVIGSEGMLYRSTVSTIAVKSDLESLWDSIGDKILKFKPIFFRYNIKTKESSDWSWYSFSAEQLAELDPRFANWDHATTYDEAGAPVIDDRGAPQLDEELSPQGIHLTSVIAAMVNLVQRLEKRIAVLEAR